MSNGQVLDYKSLKEEFVSNFHGDSVSNINLVSATALTSYALWIALNARRHRSVAQPVLFYKSGHLSWNSNPEQELPIAGWNNFFIEYLILIIPLILGLTIFSPFAVCLNTLFLIVAFALAYPINSISPPSSRSSSLPGTPPERRSHHKRDSESSQFVVKTREETPESLGILFNPQNNLPRSSPTTSTFNNDSRTPLPHSLFRKPFITVYRAHMMIMTVLCILAVDFNIFPREFAKCELWGTSIMDLGVGSFVFSLGLVSAIPRLRSRQTRPFCHSIRKSFNKTTPVLILGLLRLIAVKGVEYPEHVTEYGVHWNFFFTLSALSILGVCFDALSSKVDYVVLGLFITSAHQMALDRWGLQDWTLFAERTNIISMNKEGLMSLPGYLAILLLGTATGIYALPPDPYFFYRSLGNKSLRQKPGKLASVLSGYSILWWGAMIGVRYGLGIEVSRRLANISYVLWVVAFNVSFLLCYLLIEISAKRSLLKSVKLKLQGDHQMLVPKLFDIVNSHGLLVFLVANISTGLVNLSIQTIYVGATTAVFVLIGYSICVFGFSWWFDIVGWSFRDWSPTRDTKRWTK